MDLAKWQRLIGFAAMLSAAFFVGIIVKDKLPKQPMVNMEK